MKCGCVRSQSLVYSYSDSTSHKLVRRSFSTASIVLTPLFPLMGEGASLRVLGPATMLDEVIQTESSEKKVLFWKPWPSPHIQGWFQKKNEQQLPKHRAEMSCTVVQINLRPQPFRPPILTFVHAWGCNETSISINVKRIKFHGFIHEVISPLWI